ncbi:hypothetical protein BH23CHL5_BH23CHL5_18550 [soil metagenome]
MSNPYTPTCPTVILLTATANPTNANLTKATANQSKAKDLLPQQPLATIQPGVVRHVQCSLVNFRSHLLNIRKESRLRAPFHHLGPTCSRQDSLNPSSRGKDA